MSSVLRLRPRAAAGRVIKRGLEPVTVAFGKAQREVRIRFTDGSTGPAACLRCPDAPCMRYGAEELRQEGFSEFAVHGAQDVCPTGALEWPVDSSGGPCVDDENCIGCALCASRCPVGAIHMTASGPAVVSDVATAQIHDTAHVLPLAHAVEHRQRFAAADHEGPLVTESDHLMRRTHGAIRGLLKAGAPRLPTLLTRNLMIGVGWQAAMRRIGDVSVRMDILASRHDQLCAVEVEFCDNIIEAGRRVLDDLAVLLSRYHRDKNDVHGMVVALSLPNRRSEYWQVVQDVRVALDVRVYTLTIGALMLMLWNRSLLGGRCGEDLPYADVDSPSIRSYAAGHLGREPRISSCCESVLEPLK